MTASKKNISSLTVTELIDKLGALAEVRPKAEVCFVMAGDGPNDGWPIYEVGMIFDSSRARVLIINETEILR